MPTNPTPHAKTAEEVAKAIVAKHLDPTCQDAATIERAIAAAIRDAEERGRIAQIALDLPASLESEERGNRLEAMIERMIENNVNQGVVLLGGENGITRVAAPVGSILDDAGNVRRVQGNGLTISADGAVLTPGARVWRGGELDHDDGSQFEGWVVLSLEGGERERTRFSWVMLNGIGEATTQNLYSTREAALTAKDAHAGEKGAANGK